MCVTNELSLFVAAYSLPIGDSGTCVVAATSLEEATFAIYKTVAGVDWSNTDAVDEFIESGGWIETPKPINDVMYGRQRYEVLLRECPATD